MQKPRRGLGWKRRRSDADRQALANSWLAMLFIWLIALPPLTGAALDERWLLGKRRGANAEGVCHCQSQTLGQAPCGRV